jgi:hypothetical protein
VSVKSFRENVPQKDSSPSQQAIYTSLGIGPGFGVRREKGCEGGGHGSFPPMAQSNTFHARSEFRARDDCKNAQILEKSPGARHLDNGSMFHKRGEGGLSSRGLLGHHL